MNQELTIYTGSWTRSQHKLHRNPVARDLRTQKYRQRIVQDKRAKKDADKAIHEIGDFLDWLFSELRGKDGKG